MTTKATALRTILFALLYTSCGTGSVDGSSKPRVSRTPAPPSGDAGGLTLETSFDLSKCGYDIARPTALLSSSRLNMLPLTFTVPGLLGIFPPKQVDVNATMIAEISLTRSVITEQSSASTSGSTEELNAALERYHRGGEATLIDVDSRAKLGETYPEWKGVFCSVQAAKRIDRNFSGHVAIEFNQPLPFAPMAASNKARFLLEMKAKRAWSGIVAKVTESDDPSASVGTSWTGSVIAEPVATSVTTAKGKAVSADAAVKFTYDFGGAEKTGAIGVPSSAIWYLNFASKSVLLIQLDAGDGKVVDFIP